MGSPTAGVIAEIFLQHFVQLIVKHHLKNKSLIFLYQICEWHLIIYDQTRIDCNQILHQANVIRNLFLNAAQGKDATVHFWILLFIEIM